MSRENLRIFLEISIKYHNPLTDKQLLLLFYWFFMSKNSDKSMLGWYVPVDCRNKFAQWCTNNGLICQDDAAGALTLWPYIPSAIREQAKLQAKGIAAVDEKFWDAFRAGLELALQAQPNIRQEKKANKPRHK